MKRPWWLWASKSPKLTTTVREELSASGPIYIIRGEPVIQSLTWLVWGPLSALAMIIVLTGLAIIFEAREQSLLIKALFILAFLGLPAVVWGSAIVFVNRLSDKYLQAEREAEAQECQIQLDIKRGELQYTKKASSSVTTLPFSQIQQVNVTEPIGVRQVGAVCLALDTAHGKIVLLDEYLGTEAQKFDLAREIQNSLKRYITSIRQKSDGHVI